MILIYGRLDDPPLASTVDALVEAGADFVVLEQTTLDREDLCIEIDRSGVHGSLIVAGQELPLDSVHSIYARPLELPVRSWDRVRVASARLLHQQLWEWLDVSPALVVNRPHAMHANGSKPLQIQLIGDAGFLVPETLVTSDEGEAREFWRRHGRVVYKSASGVRSIGTRTGRASGGPTWPAEGITRSIPGICSRHRRPSSCGWHTDVRGRHCGLWHRLSILRALRGRGNADCDGVGSGSGGALCGTIAANGPAVCRHRSAAAPGRGPRLF